MMCRPLHRRGAFSLVELLVVIGVIGVVLGILLPTLSRARQVAMDALCVSNMRQLAFAQLNYATDNHGYFPPHRSGSPSFVKSGYNLPITQSPWSMLRNGYIKSGDVTICPFVANDPLYGNPAAIIGLVPNSTDVEYGGWDTINPVHVHILYALYGGFVPWAASSANDLDPTGKINFIVGPFVEVPWPTRLDNASSTSALVSHGIQTGSIGNPGYLDTHVPNQGRQPFGEFTPDWSKHSFGSTPVAYGDGHVEMHRGSDIHPRATWNDPVQGQQIWGY